MTVIINHNLIQTKLFPNKELLVGKVIEYLDSRQNYITFKYEDSDSILEFLFIIQEVYNAQALCTDVNNLWQILYMPYSRMDRSENGSCYTLAYLINMITMFIQEKDTIEVVEPHSCKTKELIKGNYKKCREVHTSTMIASKLDYDIICYPDKGARERFLMTDRPTVYCEKRRDFDTGKIIGLELVSDVDITGKRVLIVDDLCSAGGTFYYTAKKLREHGASYIGLVVTHMEKNVRTGKLVRSYHQKDIEPNIIDYIYCTDSMLSRDDVLDLLAYNDDRMAIISIQSILDGNMYPVVKKEEIQEYRRYINCAI